MSNLDLLSAGFSAILGTKVTPQRDDGNHLSIHELFSQTYVMRPVPAKLEPGEGEFSLSVLTLYGQEFNILVKGEDRIERVKAKIQEREGTPVGEIRLIYAGQQLMDFETVKHYNIQPNDSIHLVLRLRGGGGPLPRAFDTNELDPDFDYDFSDVQDDGQKYMRGGFEYKRPYGWKRIAIKVVGRYGNDDWLGANGLRTKESSGEWPVAYHGTNMSSAKLILKEGYKPGLRALFGKGIYTSPSLEMVEKLYAQEFTCKGKTYKIVLQNRVNPDQKNGRLEIIPASETGAGADYWLSPGGHANDVRPYGILIREVSRKRKRQSK